MKRLNNLYTQICSLENLRLADKKARKGKLKQPSVQEHDKNREGNILVKSIKKNFARKLSRGASDQTIASYNGWLLHANCTNLKRTLLAA
jgi:hypothetical protein